MVVQWPMTSVPFEAAHRGSAAARMRLVTPIFRVEQIAISFSFRTWNRGTIARLRVGNLRDFRMEGDP
jgi:hypothetical protein